MRTAFEREGDIRSVDLPTAFATLWNERGTGVLAFSRADQRVRFEILDGAAVGVFSSDASFDAAEILVRAGKLDPSAIEQRRVTAGRNRARAAREQGLLTERDWHWAEKIRAVEILADLLGWLEGQYSFDPAERPEPGELRIGIERLLLELFLRSRDRGFIHLSLGAADAPLQRAADFDEKFPALGLTADAEPVVAAIDGRASAAEISRRVPPDPFSVEKLLAALTTLGLVHPEYAARAPAPRRRTRERQPPPEPTAPSPEPAPPPEPPEVPVLTPGEALSLELDDTSVPTPPYRAEPIALDFEPEFAAASTGGGELEDDREPAEAPLELPLAPSPEPYEPEPSVMNWDQAAPDPMDHPLAVPEPPVFPRSSRPRLTSVWLLVLLAVAVGALLLVRARDDQGAPPGAPARTPQVVASPGGGGEDRAGASTSPVTESPPAAPTAYVATAAPTSPPRSTARPTVAPTAVPATRAAAPAPLDRGQWLARAARDRRALAADRRTRYSIQLELVCELPSLDEAWLYDRGGQMWLLTAPHGGRECFRVFWGRYPTVEQARAGKVSVPRFFFTPTNQPTVVSTRALLP